MLKITLSGSTLLQNVDPHVAAAIETNLQLPNPTYEQAIRTNPRARFSLSPTIRYYKKRRDGSYVVGQGAADAVIAYARRGTVACEINDERTRQACTDVLEESIQLRDYQRGVIDGSSQHDSGIFRLSTGFGKAILTIKLAAKHQQRTLVIVPKLDLFNQMKREVLKHTNLTKDTIGVIQGKQFRIGDITVATIQTLTNRVKDKSLKGDEFGMVIIDECHTFITPKRWDTVSHFSARRRYGMTATARRSDGQGAALKWLIGEILIEKDVPRDTPSVYISEFKGNIFIEEYADMIKAQTENEQRNAMIAAIIKEQVTTGRKVLVLTKRVAHYDKLAELVDSHNPIVFRSSMKIEERASLLDNLRNSKVEFDVIYGTMSLLSTGIDIPSLDTLVIAGDLKSDVLQEQAAGRILRLLEGKDDPRIIDIVDSGNGILKNQARLRRQFYLSKQWNVQNYDNLRTH